MQRHFYDEIYGGAGCGPYNGAASHQHFPIVFSLTCYEHRSVDYTSENSAYKSDVLAREEEEINKELCTPLTCSI